ncbi:MAG: DoxX family protein [Pseudomonadales bacterium]|nr:DoxX family protein [Pseudomonadales bacterium]
MFDSLIEKLLQQPALATLTSLASRLLMATIFILAGFSKITGYAGTVGYMQAMGVPGALAPLAILVELGGGLALLFGLWTRSVAAVLAGFCVITAFIFHHNLADQTTMIMFMKNLAMTGGLLQLVIYGGGVASLSKSHSLR